MADKNYGIYVSVGIYEYPEVDETTRHYTLELESFGVRKGQEITADQIDERGSASMVRFLNSMKRPSPFSLLWKPPQGQKLLWADIRRRKLRIKVSFVSSGNNTNNPTVMPLFTVDNVRIARILPEMRAGSAKSKYERIDTTFSKFELN
jgi:hypothetical protein